LTFASFSAFNAPTTERVSVAELICSARSPRLTDITDTTTPISKGILILNFIFFPYLLLTVDRITDFSVKIGEIQTH
jgi:hypothetical protein